MSQIIQFGEHWQPRPIVRQDAAAKVIVLPVVVSFDAAERFEQRRKLSSRWPR